MKSRYIPTVENLEEEGGNIESPLWQGPRGDERCGGSSVGVLSPGLAIQDRKTLMSQIRNLSSISRSGSDRQPSYLDNLQGVFSFQGCNEKKDLFIQAIVHSAYRKTQPQ